MRKIVLDWIWSKIVENDLELKNYLKHSLHFHQLQNKYVIKLKKLIKGNDSSNKIEASAKKFAWTETLAIGKQASDFLIYNDIVIEEIIHKEIDDGVDPLQIKDKEKVEQTIHRLTQVKESTTPRSFKSMMSNTSIFNSGNSLSLLLRHRGYQGGWRKRNSMKKLQVNQTRKSHYEISVASRRRPHCVHWPSSCTEIPRFAKWTPLALFVDSSVHPRNQSELEKVLWDYKKTFPNWENYLRENWDRRKLPRMSGKWYRKLNDQKWRDFASQTVTHIW
jgi:hypothetical protein